MAVQADPHYVAGGCGPQQPGSARAGDQQWRRCRSAAQQAGRRSRPRREPSAANAGSVNSNRGFTARRTVVQASQVPASARRGPVDHSHSRQLLDADHPAARRRVRRTDPHLKFEIPQDHRVERGGQRLGLGGPPSQAGAARSPRTRRRGGLHPEHLHVGGGRPPRRRCGLHREATGQAGQHHHAAAAARDLPPAGSRSPRDRLATARSGRRPAAPCPPPSSAGPRAGGAAAACRRFPSGRQICWLRAGWAMNIRSAACVKLPASASATKYSRWRSSIAAGAAATRTGSSAGSNCA